MLRDARQGAARGLILPALLWALASCATHPPQTHPPRPAPFAPAQVARSDSDVLTQHGDAARTGANLFETRLKPDNVASGNFQRLFHWDVDGQIYGQPLYLSHVALAGRTINMVIVTTMNNSVYAFEAPAAQSDQQPSRDALWHVAKDKLGSPLPFNYFPIAWGILGYNIKPQIGIVSTPVVDRELGVVYVTAKSSSGGWFFGIGRHIHYKLFAIDLLSGKVKQSAEIMAQFKGADGVSTRFDPSRQMQRPGLLETHGQIYLAFASHQDTKPYHGWVMAYDATTLKQSAIYCTTCGHAQADECDASCEGGIWQAGGGPVADRAGNVYVMTGNGSFDKGVYDLSTSFIKLDGGLHPLGSWTPPNYQCLNRTDSDLGSAGPLLIEDAQSNPANGILIGGGKEGLLYAIRADSLHGPQIGDGTPLGLEDVPGEPCAFTEPASDHLVRDRSYWMIQAAPLWQGDFIMDAIRLIAPAGLAQGYHHIHGAPVLWNVHDGSSADRSLLYVSAERDLLRAYEFKQGFPGASPPGTPPNAVFESTCPNSHQGMPGGFLTLSANGGDANSGIVWAAMPRRNKDALNRVVPGVLRAYRAYPGAAGTLVEIWNSDEGPHPMSDGACDDDASVPDDELGLFAKFVPPTVSEGKVYMATFSHQLVVYGLKTSAPSSARLAAATGLDSLLSTNSLPPSVKPGATVAISIVARNTGTATWHAADQIRLSSRFIPGLENQIVEGARALALPGDIEPQQSYTFSFHIRVPPEEEGVYYYKWQLTEAMRHRSAAGWFGGTTPEWRFSVLRPDCAALRQRAAAATAAMPHPEAKMQIPADQADSIKSIIDESEKKKCRLMPDGMDMGVASTDRH
jgi:hypothetical protein